MTRCIALFISLWAIFGLSACGSRTADENVLQYEAATEPLQAGRGFVEAVLKGDFAVAKQYCAPAPNLDQLVNEVLERPYNQLPAATQKELGNSSIRIDKLEGNGSLRALFYGNASADKQRRLNLIKNGSEWKVIFDASTEPPF